MRYCLCIVAFNVDTFGTSTVDLSNLMCMFFQVGCPRILEMGGVISLYNPTTTLQPEVLGFVWCTLARPLPISRGCV